MKILSLAIVAIAFAGCAGQTFSPKDAAAYASAAHTVIHGGISDYKAVREVQRRK